MVFKNQIILIILLLIVVHGQSQNRSLISQQDSLLTFNSVTELIQYASTQNIDLQNNSIRLDQAKKAKIAAALGVVDITGNLLSAQFTDNTKLGVNLFPAEVFGGTEGTFREVQTGVRYNTNLTNYADIKLVNMAGWVNLKLSKINIDLTASNNLISLKKLQENIATNYFNIVNLEKQIWNTRLNLNASDTLFSIVQNKYEEGLVKQQDVNEAKVIVIELEESISQLEQLKEQYYISLKLLCDIPEETKIEIKHESTPPAQDQSMMVQLNNLELKNALLKEQYLLKDIETAKTSFYPTLSLQLSNSFNLYNQDFKPFSGNWINNNYIGLRLNVPIPNAQTVAKKHNADFEYKLAVNNTQQAKEQAYLNRKNLEVEYNNTASLKQSKVEILALRRENYFKNKNLYEEGLISLDDTIKSFKEMINAEYNLVSQEVNTELIASKITINNNIR